MPTSTRASVPSHHARASSTLASAPSRAAKPSSQPARAISHAASVISQPAKAILRPAKAFQHPASAFLRPAMPFQQAAKPFLRPAMAILHAAKASRQPAKLFLHAEMMFRHSTKLAECPKSVHVGAGLVPARSNTCVAHLTNNALTRDGQGPALPLQNLSVVQPCIRRESARRRSRPFWSHSFCPSRSSPRPDDARGALH
jgi:hypothetical protein